MEIKSSLLNSKDFALTKQSLIEVSEHDHEENFRVKLIEYIDDTADNNDDMFFYDMLEFTRFLNPYENPSAAKHVAFTDPNKLIYLNAPNDIIGKSIRKWEFVYDHECLHQLWDTFGVAEKIKAAGYEYNHMLLNIASDCVINDYLYYYRKKERFEDGIFPEYLKKEYDVDYDRKSDTQYTLYLKLLEKKKEIEKDKDKLKQMMDEQDSEGDGQESNSQSSQGGQGSQDSQGSQDNNQSNSSNSNNSNNGGNLADDNTAEGAKQNAQKAKEISDNINKANNDGKLDDAAKEAEDAAKEAKDAAKRAQEAKDANDKSGEEKAAKEAKDALDKAKKAAEKANVDTNTDSNANDGNKTDASGSGKGNSNSSNDTISDADLEQIKAKAQNIIEKYKSRIAGDFGKFINKCKSSIKLEKNGLAQKISKGTASWNLEMNSIINKYVKNKVFQKKRQYKKTYSRFKRGAGFVTSGTIINPGKKIKDDKLTINAAFYIDKSGSMGGSIDNVFKACYTICESLKKQFSKEAVVDEVVFKIFAFDMNIKEIPYGKKASADGGTCDFSDIFDYIKNETNTFLINIIITDAASSVDKNKVKKLINDIAGMVIFIANNDSQSEIKELAKEYNTKLFYILADSDFTIK